ncbi:TetR/AcrR family transcriptional regulator [Lihuaxuella thermophila]|uniref:DNA-binding transcriptional regulator, AcrR family n=1 Tax=Lihuaxuella thermophila TaxID=1173111 RepID=A0A1H8CB81_9BACL|nr:TetR/AcrR family transcriptional regulator [Lihuaxuella thermophila]SEM91367.1 DNA-binding transcriptional regulator, AcrR family [Lihuaxuella thermophila]
MKQKIVEESIKLFEIKGYSETSIQDIVDALGVTKGTFYYYFDSKEQLLMDIQLMYINELLERQQEILLDPNKDCKTKVFENIRLLIKQIRTHGRKAKIFFRELMNLNPDHYLIIKHKRSQFRLNLQKIIEMGMERGEFRTDLRADLVTFSILGMCNWSYNWFNPDGPAPDDELIQTYVEILLKGINHKN